MQRDLLNNVPDWGVFLIFVAIAAAVAIIGYHVVRRFAPEWRKEDSSGTVAAVAAMVMTLFALVLAFTVVNLYTTYQEASGSVSQEASSLAEIVHDANAFPQPARNTVDSAVAAYIHTVVNHEFPQMRNGGQDFQSITAQTAMFDALQKYSPKTQSEVTFYDSAVSNLNDVVSLRRTQIEDADSSLPAVFIALLLLTALLSIIITLFFNAASTGLEITLVACVAIVVGAGLLTTLVLQYPFSGSLAVSPAPLTQGTLAHLLTQFR